MNSLVIGASGQVGSLLYEMAGEKEQCVGTFFRHSMPGLCHLDLRDENAVKELVHQVNPEVCYVPGALTFVDYAENHPQECHTINVRGIAHVARALAGTNGLLVFFSTDHVFGDNPHPWKEEDPVCPQSVYAQSKAEAENLVRQLLPEDHLILRTSWVFGPDPRQKNFFWRVRLALKKGESLTVPRDQYGQPTYGPDLAHAARLLVERRARGTFHVVGPQCLSRFAWARLIAETLDLPADLIKGQETCKLDLDAPRPRHVQLDRSKLLSTLGADPICLPKEGVSRAERPA